MDESVELFQPEQERIRHEGGPGRLLMRQIKAQMIAVGSFAVIAWDLMAGLGALPRNADNSMKLIYYGPALAILSIVAALFLRTKSSVGSPLRLTAWSVIVLAIIAIPAGFIDYLAGNGS